MIRCAFLTSVRVLKHNELRSPICISKRFMAGHSKWQNIKHIKGLKDAQRSANFAKLAQQMRVAIADGKSANPDTNLQLRQTIEVAKRQNMPVEKIDNVLKTAQNTKSADQLKPSVLELRGPGPGCYMVVTVLTKHIKNTRGIINSFCKKANVSVSEGAAKHTFEHKGVIYATATDGSINLDASMEHAIEAGAEEVECTEESNSFVFTCDPLHVYNVRQKLETLKCYNIEEAKAMYIPNTVVELSDEHMQVVSALCDKLQEHPDVVDIFDNIA